MASKAEEAAERVKFLCDGHNANSFEKVLGIVLDDDEAVTDVVVEGLKAAKALADLEDERGHSSAEEARQKGIREELAVHTGGVTLWVYGFMNGYYYHQIQMEE